MELHLLSTMNCSGSKKVVAQYVEDLLKSLEPDCVLITTIRRGLSEDYFVTSAIGESSDGIETQIFSKELQSILDNTQGG